jgi:hypothetical protein
VRLAHHVHLVTPDGFQNVEAPNRRFSRRLDRRLRTYCLGDAFYITGAQQLQGGVRFQQGAYLCGGFKSLSQFLGREFRSVTRDAAGDDDLAR